MVFFLLNQLKNKSLGYYFCNFTILRNNYLVESFRFKRRLDKY